MMMMMAIMMMMMTMRNVDEAGFAAMDHGSKLHAGDTSDMSMTTMGMMIMMMTTMMMMMMMTTTMMMMGRMHHGWKLQGTAGDTFYIISEGDVKVTSSSSLSSSSLSSS